MRKAKIVEEMSIQPVCNIDDIYIYMYRLQTTFVSHYVWQYHVQFKFGFCPS